MPSLRRQDEKAAITASDVVLVVFDGAEAIDIAGPASVFSKAELLHPGTYRLHIASAGGGTVDTNSGLKLLATGKLRQLPAEIDTLVVVGGEEAPLRAAIRDQGSGARCRRSAVPAAHALDAGPHRRAQRLWLGGRLATRIRAAVRAHAGRLSRGEVKL
jgi:transcriptional regulator GlxA family with amidase domain